MQKTLLAHLAPKLTTQVENAATEALAFILNKSEACRQALGELLRSDDFPLKAISWRWFLKTISALIWAAMTTPAQRDCWLNPNSGQV